MKFKGMKKYICPKCGEYLLCYSNYYECRNRHLYDISKNGYINLLLNFDKNSLFPGDAKESLIARKEFLNKGYYNIVLENIIDLISKYKKDDSFSVLDIGCGEGYYTYKVKQRYPNSDIYGFDISKQGIALATKYTKKDVNWFVANSKNIPIKDKSMDFILSIFSFVTPSEIERILKKSGYVIQVCALDEHLIEIKELFYDRIINKKMQNKLLPFKIVDTFNLTKKVKITKNEDLINLFKMTPHFYRVKKDKKFILNDLNNIDITINVIINVYRVG